LPPKAKLRLRSKGAVDAGKLAAIQAKAPAGIISSALVTSGATAKRIQAAMKMGTAILDVDFAVPPNVRMSFQPGDAKPPAERDVEDLDLACGQALAGN
jgi:hypothetical protein